MTGSVVDAEAEGFAQFVEVRDTPDGTTAYVVNYSSDTVTPINTATNAAGPPIRVGKNPVAIAIVPAP